MSDRRRLLLAVDAVVNLLLGILLLLAPTDLLETLGLPPIHTTFYATILGGVILGIGVALCVELWGATRSARGLSLGGAIAINLCGGGVLLAWLLWGSLELPTRGYILLWLVALLVLGIGLVELATGAWRDVA